VTAKFSSTNSDGWLGKTYVFIFNSFFGKDVFIFNFGLANFYYIQLTLISTKILIVRNGFALL